MQRFLIVLALVGCAKVPEPIKIEPIKIEPIKIVEPTKDEPPLLPEYERDFYLEKVTPEYTEKLYPNIPVPCPCEKLRAQYPRK